MTSGKPKRNRWYIPTPGEQAADKRAQLCQVRRSKEEWIKHRDNCSRMSNEAGRHVDALTAEELTLMTALGMAPEEVTE